MYSPFYTAEQKRLYPHRKICNTVDEIVSHFKRLNKKGVINYHFVHTTPLCDLMLNYFMGCNADQILAAIRLIENLTTNKATDKQQYSPKK